MGDKGDDNQWISYTFIGIRNNLYKVLKQIYLSGYIWRRKGGYVELTMYDALHF